MKRNLFVSSNLLWVQFNGMENVALSPLKSSGKMGQHFICLIFHLYFAHKECTNEQFLFNHPFAVISTEIKKKKKEKTFNTEKLSEIAHAIKCICAQLTPLHDFRWQNGNFWKRDLVAPVAHTHTHTFQLNLCLTSKEMSFLVERSQKPTKRLLKCFAWRSRWTFSMLYKLNGEQWWLNRNSAR